MERPMTQHQWTTRYILYRSARFLILVLGGVWLGMTLLVWIMQERLLFPADRSSPTMFPSDIGIPFERFTVETDDGEQLDVWWMPQEPYQQAPTVLFAHGNAGNMQHRMETYRSLRFAGANVLTFDYRGYGDSSGRPSADGLRKDGEAIWAFARDHLHIPAETIILHGRSLGGAVAIHIAAKAEHPPAGLIVESAFADLHQAARDSFPFLPITWVARHQFPNSERIATVNAPILIMHSQEDEMIGYHHAEQLHAATTTKDARLVPLRGSHNHGWTDANGDWTNLIESFIKEHAINKD
ncbi:MAG: alpha/beta fold hydrolase [Planctomycetota bacterium]|nr:MAG: alpha/beta fold hydrolase [Planctomycetota bacterium]